MNSNKFLLVFLLGLFFGSLYAAPRLAQGELRGEEDHCRQGDLRSIIEAYYPTGFDDVCSFRTFLRTEEEDREEWEGPICFCERDVFVGGDVWTYPQQGEAYGYPSKEFLDLFEVVYEMIEPEDTPDGASIEPFTTSIKGYVETGFEYLCEDNPDLDDCFDFFNSGAEWQRQYGVIFQNLPAGKYLMHRGFKLPPEIDLVAFYNDPNIYENEVSFRVLNHKEAHKLGRPEGGFGSVVCPPE